MVVPPSEQLAQRYSLQLTADWCRWFDYEAERDNLWGPFRTPVDVAELLETAPPDLWPGFMLPDTLPLVSNDYGDWWCLRVGAQDEIAEVIQWSHAGGDWLPVGKTIAQAALWDHIQRWRTQAIGVQPAAHEYPLRSQPDSISSYSREKFIAWLSSGLHASVSELQRLLTAVEQGEYRRGLGCLLEQQWSIGAASCELVEVSLQGPLTLLADTRLANRCGINWAPEYTSWLFDTDKISTDARRMLLEYSPNIEFSQDWQTAERWAMTMQQSSNNLSWTGDIAGWAAERRGDLSTAIERYYQNRFTSAFTDQSVRLRSHWFPERFGKFSVAQLSRLEGHLTDQQRSDAYLQLLWHEPIQRTRAAIVEYWLSRARNASQLQMHDQAYYFYTQAGWDLGAERLSDYIEILDGLTRSAELAGWRARAQVAAAHARCLRGRMPPSQI